MLLQEIARTPPWKDEEPITAEGCVVVLPDMKAALCNNIQCLE